MQLGDHLGFAGLVVAAIGIAISILWAQKRWVGYLFLGVAAVIGSFWVYFTYFAIHDEPTEHNSHVATSEPHISAQLIIDSATTKNTNYRLVIENGAVKISNVSVSVRSDQGDEDFSPSPRQDMLPMSRKEYPGPPTFNNIRPLSLEFIVTFNALNQLHFARFTFFVASKTVSSQPYLPTGSEEGLGDGGAKEDSQEMPFRQFVKPTGTISLTFPEAYPDGSPNQMFLKTTNRQLLINPATRKVAFQGIFKVGQKTVEQPFLTDKHTEFGTHILTATWDDRKQSIGLSVDGAPLVTR